jgi:HEAT repeat protein
LDPLAIGDITFAPWYILQIMRIDQAGSSLTVRKYAARALGKIKDARAVEPLMANLADQPSPANAAAEALGRIGESAVEPLIAALKDPEDRIRAYAARGLEVAEDPRAVKPLIARL